MKKYEIDLTEIHNMFHEDPNRIPVIGNEQRLVRVAFDLFRLKGDVKEDLWQVQADDDGKEYLVRMYSIPEEEEVKSNWNILEDSKQANLTVAYNKTPIYRISCSEYGIEPSDISIFSRAILKKLATDKNFEIVFFNKLPASKQELLKMAGFSAHENDYDSLFNQTLKQFGASSLGSLSAEGKELFFNEINKKMEAIGTDKRLLDIENNLRTKEADDLGLNKSMRVEKKKNKKIKAPTKEDINSVLSKYFEEKDKEDKKETKDTE